MAKILGFLNELAKGGDIRKKWNSGDKTGAMTDFGLDPDQQKLIHNALTSGNLKAIFDRVGEEEVPALWVK